MSFVSARYSPSVSDDLDFPGTAAPPPGSSDEPAARRGSSSGVVGWLIVAVVVLVLAVAGGLFTAFIVANMRAVPGPVAGFSPAPSFAAGPSSGPVASASASPAQASEAPRRTPTPLPSVEVTAPPFTYVVQPGDHLVNIADMFGVDVQDIIDLNDIKNPNRLFVGQELLIPGYGVQPTPKPTKTPRK
jgi:LysM repeat protein